LSNIYLLYGDEDLSLKEKINQLRSGLQVEQYDGEEKNLEAIISALQTPALLFGERLILVKGIDLGEECWAALIPHIKALAPGVKVIFWAEAAGKRSGLYKLLDEIGEVLEFRPFAEWEQDKVLAWIVRKVKAEGKDIGRQAALTLQEICGNNLMKLASEIEKLVTYIGARPAIEPGDVEALASAGDISVFALADAVTDKNISRALQTFRTLYRNKVEIVRLMALLAGQFRIMLASKDESDSGRLARFAGSSPYYVKKCAQKAAKFKPLELKRGLETMFEADLKLKSGEDQATVFELVLTSLCCPEGGAGGI
jgi:DNA polymerase-3 subunit delta